MIMYLTRTLYFSAVHSSNNSYHKLGTMGYDYKLHLTLGGQMNTESGIVINIVDIDKVIDTFVKSIDGKWLEKDVPFFSDNKYSLENLLFYFWHNLKVVFRDVSLEKIKIEQTPFFYGEIEEAPNMNIYLTKIFHFSSAHRLHSPYLSDVENIDLFGKCNNFYGHGHNYKLEVTVKGQPDPRTGTIVNYKELEKIVNDRVVKLFDHRHLNEDLDLFQDKNPTSEILLMVTWDLLKAEIPNLYKLGIWETEKNYFEYYGPNHQR